MEFKKHPIRDPKRYLEIIMKDIGRIHEVRLLAIVSGYYFDYIINELIIEHFKKPKLIIDGSDYSFDKKVTLLDALGFWDDKQDTFNNLKRLNEIRNHYAHNMVEDSNAIPTKILDKIMTLNLPSIIKYKEPHIRLQSGIGLTIGNLIGFSKHFNPQDVKEIIKVENQLLQTASDNDETKNESLL